MNEYREMLAERLLALPDYSTAQDVRTLELLKIRFGAVCLFIISCYIVMLFLNTFFFFFFFQKIYCFSHSSHITIAQ